MYAKKLTLNRGVDNVILFEFINQDQKPINITGSTFTFRVNSSDNQTVLLAQDLTILSATTGRAKVSIASSALDSLLAGPARWSIERASGVLSEGAYVDQAANSSGMVEITDAVYPQFVASNTVSLPDQAPAGGPVYTSIIETTKQELTTVAFTTDAYEGTIQIQGSINNSSDWYNIGSTLTYTGESGINYVNVEGFHPYLRVALGVTSGTVTKIMYR